MCAPALPAIILKTALGAAVTMAASRLLAVNPAKPQQVSRNAPPPVKAQRAAGVLKEEQDLRDETQESERSTAQRLARKRKQEGTKTLGSKEAPGVGTIAAPVSDVPDMGITAPVSGGTY